MQTLHNSAGIFRGFASDEKGIESCADKQD